MRESVDPLKEARALQQAKLREELPLIPKKNTENDYGEWEPYKIGIHVVASNVSALFLKSINQRGWVDAELAFEPYTIMLFNFIFKKSIL